MRLFRAAGLYNPTPNTPAHPEHEEAEAEELYDEEPMLEGDEPVAPSPSATHPRPVMHPDDNRPLQCTNQSIRRSAAQWAGTWQMWFTPSAPQEHRQVEVDRDARQVHGARGRLESEAGEWRGHGSYL